jgi:hypothetical protein
MDQQWSKRRVLYVLAVIRRVEIPLDLVIQKHGDAWKAPLVSWLEQGSPGLRVKLTCAGVSFEQDDGRFKDGPWTVMQMSGWGTLKGVYLVAEN